ncbi:DKNYY domain-containing protein [Costertonia aggregata]|uniref:DKNYY domain-containing protein n=1 Tax=Costertonia aggregata TaxID=343403 RepID=A0A7H9ALU3_9FLAO|nr:DKNYY domain-containing protein [Costertonia aggregata]QLG44344.1 DKNYY domain-containing protein [Costertonia aggregata]
MKSILKILFAPLIWIIHSCSPIGEPVKEQLSNNHYYNRNNTDIIYSSGGNWFGLGKKAMNVDMDTFEVLNGLFAKDKNNLYCYHNKVSHPKLDLESFYAKGETAVERDKMNNIGFDKNHVYVTVSKRQGDIYTTGITILEDADPKTFKKIDYHGWAKDHERYYYRNALIHVDYDSFTFIDEFFSKDKNHVYWHTFSNFVKTDANPETFVSAEKSKYIAIDDKALYVTNYSKDQKEPITIPYTSKDSIKVYDDMYFKVGRTVYYVGKPILEADIETFELLEFSYAKDKNHVFYNGKKIEGADPNSFEHDEGARCKDKNGYFLSGEAYEFKEL